MNVSAKLIFYIGAFSLAIYGCSKDTSPGNYHPEVSEIAIDSTPIIPLSVSWKLQLNLMKGFPGGLQIYRRTLAFSGKALNAYCAVFEPAKIEFKPLLAVSNKKPGDFLKDESGALVCINAGFFGTNASYSLIKYNEQIASVNIKSLNRLYKDINTPYYPTRGAFGLTDGGVPDITWIYHTGGSNTIYSYPSPSSNELNKAPQPVPTATFPTGGKLWTVKSAAGGSPVLLKDGELNITDKEELIVVDNTSSRARSAIGYTASGKVMLLAVEGNSPNSSGLSLQELARLMKEMGCKDALNLDGGGSSAMVVNGSQTIVPSDVAGERAVMGVIVLKSK